MFASFILPAALIKGAILKLKFDTFISSIFLNVSLLD